MSRRETCFSLLSILAGFAVAGVLASPRRRQTRGRFPLGVTIGGVQVGGRHPEADATAVQQGFQTPLELSSPDPDPRHPESLELRGDRQGIERALSPSRTA